MEYERARRGPKIVEINVEQLSAYSLICAHQPDDERNAL